jgi:hypothetical protein
MLRRLGAAAATVLLVAACGHDVQTTSGQAYLAGQGDWRTPTQASARTLTPMDRAVRDAASVEPTLRFPARIGLARLEGGRLTPVPPEEADAWITLARRLGPSYGEFVPINPLVAQLAASAAEPPPRGASRSPIDTLRLGAARQHVDAVLIYEVAGRGRDSATPFSALDLTIVGAFLVPSRVVAGEATAYAVLLDVRNGYPYGNAMAQGRNSGLSTLGQSWGAVRDARVSASTQAVENLTVEVEGMMTRLSQQLAALPPPRNARPARAR